MSLVRGNATIGNSMTVGLEFGQPLAPDQQYTNVTVWQNEIIFTQWIEIPQANGIPSPIAESIVPVFQTLQALNTTINTLNDEVAKLRAKVGV